MYLLVFVVMIISLIGVFAQATAVQTARIAASQVTMAQTMMTWHGAAISMAASILDQGISHPASGCSLTFTPWAPTMLQCTSPTNVPLKGTVTSGTPPTLNYIIPLSGGTELVHLPSTYDYVDYQFYSVLFDDTTSGQPEVITFIPPAPAVAGNAPPYYLVLPPANLQIGVTASDLYQQLQHSGYPVYSYGTLNALGTQLVTPANAQNITYSLPAGIAAPNSIAIVSSPAGL